MKKNTLFEDKEMGTIPLETIRLYEPEKQAYIHWKTIFERYNVSHLKLWSEEGILPLLKRKNIEVLSVDGIVKKNAIIDNFFAKKTKAKIDWVSFLAFFMADQRNVVYYVSSLTSEQVLLWRKVIMNLYCSKEQFQEWTGKSNWLTTAKSSFYYQPTPISDIVWFHALTADSDKMDKYGFRGNTTYFYLPLYLRHAFAPLFFPDMEAYTIETYPELPEKNLFVFNGELTFLQYYPILQALYEQNVLCMGKTKMLATTVKKVSKHLNLKEFFEEGLPFGLSQLRASTMLPTVALLFGYVKKYKKQPMEETLKNFGDFLQQVYSMSVPYLLPHITGIKSSVISVSTIHSLIGEILGVIPLSVHGWISVQDITNQLLVFPHGINPLQIFDPYQLQNLHLSNNETDEHICLSNLTKHLGIPFLKGVLYMLASLGLLEVAYRYRKVDDASDFDTLQYFRLTELGKYAFNLTSTYTPPQNEEAGELFHLDEQRLVIRSLKENNPYESLLNDTAISIGNHRYMMSNESFLKNCRSEKDVKDKIDFFKRFISKDIPEVWSEFFESLLRQCHPLKSISADKYAIYQLDGNNKELIQLLSSDPLLRSIIIRAEGYKILVEKIQQKTFMDKLKAHGYLL